VGTALHALSLLVQQRLLLDVAAYHDRCELVVLPPLCPLAVPSSDFSRGRQLIDRARRATGEWLDEGRHHTAHPERFLSLHRHDHTATATRPHRSTPTQQEELT
jgi:NTE family protein